MGFKMKKFWRAIKKFFAIKKPVVIVNEPIVLPPETNIEWSVEEVEFQRLPELPISKGRKAKIDSIVIHYTNGWRNQKAFDAILFMQRMGHGYLFIDSASDGTSSCWQHINLDEAYAHAGISKMPSFSKRQGSGVSSFSIGIEVACGGRLNPVTNKTSFGKYVDEENRRDAIFSIHGKTGRYEIMTPEQETCLFNTVLTLCRLNKDIHPSNIVGHHEISPTRRDDPAASLSMGMHKFRAMIADELNRSI